jgi:hypothetical protein
VELDPSMKDVVEPNRKIGRDAWVKLQLRQSLRRKE